MSPEARSPRDIVQSYIDRGMRIVYWPAVGDTKGPTFHGWPEAKYPIEDYDPSYRVGLLTGVEVAHGRFLHDVDIDWAPGAVIAQAMLPPTDFVYGRPSKRVSHCFYLLPEGVPSYAFLDIKIDPKDKAAAATLIEIRGTKSDGTVGLESMVPPSIWSRGDLREPLQFVRAGDPTFCPEVGLWKQRVTYAAIGMLLAKHLGINGFGHDTRLAWAGFLLRAGIGVEDLVAMGEAMSAVCQNREIADVRRAVESTAAALEKGGKKVKGGPALIKIIGDHAGKLIVARINEWLGRDSDFVRDDRGAVVRDHQGNIRRAMELMNVELRYNTFSEKILVTANEATHPLDDAILEGLWLRTDSELHFRPTFTFFEMVVKAIARDNRFHPVRDYLDGLHWDGQLRLDEWLIRYGGAADSDYVRHVSAIMLIAAVKRVRDPGCKYDEMVVLESSQGKNKSSVLRALCPDDSWFSDDLPLNVDSKQVIERTLGKWIIEASDLAGKRKSDNEHLKAMLSRQVDGPARMAYARIPVERRRQFILVGTTNSADYLSDSTGSRRYWPVEVRGFRVADLVAVRDQLWAEAAHREGLGESIRLHESLWPAAGIEQERRTTADAWEEIIREVVAETTPATDGSLRIPTSDLWAALAIEVARRDRAGALRISEIMQKLGFQNTAIRVAGGGVVRGYSRREDVGATLIADDDIEHLGRRPIPGVDDAF